jgi:copper(I)-binding protein
MKAVLLCAIALGAISPAQAQVRVVDPWVRSTVAGQTVAGAFMKLESPVAESLVGASSPAAARVELHRTIMEGTMAKMRPVGRIDLAPGKPVELKPGGYHMMLVDIAKPLAKGDRVPLRLEFERPGKPRETVDVEATVKDVMAPMHASHPHGS